MSNVREMLEALYHAPLKPRFMRDMLVKPGMTGCEAEEVEFDMRKGNLRIAPFIVEGAGGVNIDRDPFQTKSMRFPWIAPKRTTTASQGRQRAFGESHYAEKSEEERLREIEARDLSELTDAVDMRMEMMIAQLIFTGRIDINVMTRGGELQPGYVVDIGFDNKVTLTSGWDAAGVDPSDAMSEGRDMVLSGGGTADIIIMDKEAEYAMMRNDKFKSDYDVRRIDYGMLQPSWTGPFVKCIGRNKDGIEMYSYNGSYVEQDGSVKPFVPRGTVMVGTKQMLEMLTGPVTLMDENEEWQTYVDYVYVPQILGDRKHSVKELTLYSRPLFKPTNVDGWAVLKVL